MTGFIRGLFGSRKAETDAGSTATPGDSGAYFLDADSAKTYGDIDYMRTTKAIKRTFPKGGPRISEVSSEKWGNGSSDSTAAPSQSSTPSTPKFSAPSNSSTGSNSFTASERRKPDKGMDMFRDMAKDIRKG